MWKQDHGHHLWASLRRCNYSEAYERVTRKLGLSTPNTHWWEKMQKPSSLTSQRPPLFFKAHPMLQVPRRNCVVAAASWPCLVQGRGQDLEPVSQREVQEPVLASL